MMAQNGLYVLRYSGSITYEKTMNEWDKIFNGQPLNQSRVLRIPSNSEIVILDKNTSRAYTYKCVMAKKITVGQIIKDVKENENGTIKRFFSLLLKSAKSKVSFFPYGATIMSSSEDPTQGFCSFLKSYFKKRKNDVTGKRVLSLRKKEGKEGFGFCIKNSSNDGYYFNVVRISEDGKFHICYNLYELDNKNEFDVSLYVGPKETLDLFDLKFEKTAHNKYYLIASKFEFSWRLLEENLNDGEFNIVDYDKNDYFVGMSK